MKLNNLSNPSRVILSNLARVILSKAKNPVLAASLVAFAACSDYLEDFQDKYDDGNAFAEITSDSDNGDDDGSSDSKLSSSNGGDSDVESSDSTDSSSSAADPGSSSSVAESSSSAFKPCTGTVIYDAEEDSVYNRFGRKFITFVQEYGSDWSKTSPDGVTAYLPQEGLLIMPLVESPDTMNIEPWGGFCVEYTGSGVLHANVVDGSSANKPILLYKEMPNTNGEKSSFTWSWNENVGLMEKQEDNGSSEGFSIEKVESINFISYLGNSSITIHKITTLKPNVSIDEYLKCDGSTITPQHIEYWSSLGSFQERTYLKPGSEYNITLLGNNTVLVNHPDDQVRLAQAKGFCIEYSSDKNFLLSFHRYETNGTLTNDSANVSIYKGEKKISYILWQDLERRFGSFSSTNIHLLTFSAKQTENDTTNILISRMTLIN
ncbi:MULTISPECIES: hypothetical protein [unclassified Fibrobacter]|uniref:hypothetical protein n=1 Tax=unclassified Fibrobacter TaxID=2634177 RepID=UPI00091C1FF9|nr:MULTISPECIES: hypothetical protein [unclassified Fibrobacter]OWV07578.1 hypothetical protein B7993_01655 [Fibrobacter sp. UWH3]SHK59664.1 hypothetical protein SAMN05720765_103231 [Fibrobacter sp. UWH6]